MVFGPLKSNSRKLPTTTTMFSVISGNCYSNSGDFLQLLQLFRDCYSGFDDLRQQQGWGGWKLRLGFLTYALDTMLKLERIKELCLLRGVVTYI